MKTILLFVLLASHAQAATLTCWNIFSPRGSTPILRASIDSKVDLSKVVFNLQDKYFESYFMDETGNAGPNWGNQPTRTLSGLKNPQDVLSAELITTGRSPYKGHHQFSFVFGSYSFSSPYHNSQGEYAARLILPRDLSAQALESTRLRDPNERSNGVVILPPPYGAGQGGDNYLRLFCKSDL